MICRDSAYHLLKSLSAAVLVEGVRLMRCQDSPANSILAGGLTGYGLTALHSKAHSPQHTAACHVCLHLMPPQWPAQAPQDLVNCFGGLSCYAGLAEVDSGVPGRRRCQGRACISVVGGCRRLGTCCQRYGSCTWRSAGAADPQSPPGSS